MLPALVILLMTTVLRGADLTDAIQSQSDRKILIESYEKHPGKWGAKDLLPIAISYALEKKFDQAKIAYQKFLAVEPDNVRAIRGLGNIYLLQGKQVDEAVVLFEKAWGAGDVDSLHPLAVAYFATKQYHKIKPLVPDLLKMKNQDIQVVNTLAAYSFNVDPPDKAVFLEALKGISDDDLVKDENAAHTVIKGSEFFGDVTHAQVLKAKMPKTL